MPLLRKKESESTEQDQTNSLCCKDKQVMQCSGGEMAERQVTFAKQKSKSSSCRPCINTDVRTCLEMQTSLQSVRLQSRSRMLPQQQTWTTLSSNSLNILSVLFGIVVVHLSAPARWNTKLGLTNYKSLLGNASIPSKLKITEDAAHCDVIQPWGWRPKFPYSCGPAASSKR